LKAMDSKSIVRANVPGVRIPVSPHFFCLSRRVHSIKIVVEFRGEVTEWLKVHDWNSCVGQLTGGSNPPLSATQQHLHCCG
jgi:hypothetical protein